jgi:hypothetical protein
MVMYEQSANPTDVATPGEPPEARSALVARYLSQIRRAKQTHKKAFDRMVEDMYICFHGAPKRWGKNRYVVNITHRFMRQKVATLYAKNPKAVAKRRRKLDFQLWDGKAESLQMAMMAQEQGSMTGQMDPMAMALLQDIQETKARQSMLDRVAKTLEVLYEYFTKEQTPTFKAQMKKVVRAAVQTGVGYIGLGFQREMDFNPAQKAQIDDMQKRLRYLERMVKQVEDGDRDVAAAEMEELRLAIQEINANPAMVVREGPIFDKLGSTSVIPDDKCTDLIGWVGAEWIAEEFFLTKDEFLEFYKVDLKENDYRPYSTSGKEYSRNPRADLEGEKRDDLICCYRMQHKPSGLVYEMADGYKDFCREPAPPSARVEQFFTIFPLCFNAVESDCELFPLSDVRLMLPQQEEMNRSRQAMREHRKASLPKYVSSFGSLSDDEKLKLGNDEVATVVEVGGMIPGQKVLDFIQPVPKIPIDPGLYETQSIMADVMWSMGAQEAAFGGTSQSTATEASIAEGNRTVASEADTDELDDFLTTIARATGQVLMQEISQEEATRIAGPGAVWPAQNRGEIMEELNLEIVAGSNGRPNKAQKQYAIQQLGPIALQVPGISPHWFARQIVESLDEGVDLEEAYTDGLPSMLSMADQQQPATGDPESSPEKQGKKGKDNGAQPPRPGNTPDVPVGGPRAQV